MYQFPGDYLMTYDPSFKEEHTDSSDFEESSVPVITKKRGNHKLLNYNHIQKRSMIKPRCIMNHNQETYDEYDQYPVKLNNKSSKEIWETKAVSENNAHSNEKSRKKHKTSMNLNSGEQPKAIQSKISVFRHKIIPCLSSIFTRSHTTYTKNNSINSSDVEYTALDNGCQHCSHCERRRMRKMHKRQQNYAVQPVYAIEGNIHKTQFRPTKTEEPLQKHNLKKTRNEHSSCSISSSSESETQLAERKQNSTKFMKRFKREVIKEHWNYQQNQHFKNQQHQYPSKDHKSPYQVFTTPYQQSRTNVSASNSQYMEMPSTSSGFWDYLFDKINRKYQTQRLEIPKPCQCSSGEQMPCSPSNCEHLEPKTEPTCCNGRQHIPPGNSCSCKATAASQTPPKEAASACCQKNSPSEALPELPPPVRMKIKQEKKVTCKCHDKAAKQPNMANIPKLPSQAGTSTKPCQEGHDEIRASLAEKYNGEILCIHNPPCILINGCLNLPPQKETPQMNFWPVTESKKSAFTKKSPVKCEQACQYHVPYVEVRQCQTPEFKVEKKIQSICDHDPPCEVVRGCYKPKYDPKLQNSCVHVPMCKKTPECVIGRAEVTNSCQHRPKCPDIPMCSRNYTVLTAKENFGTQVKPKMNRVCRHAPPCIMVPRCLGKAMCESYVPCEAIPDCAHHPVCEMIPACCRRSTKEMVSVSSQYPNSCRIV